MRFAVLVNAVVVAGLACGKTAAVPPESTRPAEAAPGSGTVAASSTAPAAEPGRAAVEEEPSRARAPLPLCGSADWNAMGNARAKACSAKRTEFETTACRVITKAWRCPADIREAFAERFGPDSVIVMRPNGGEWYGIVFAKRDGAWHVIGFDGGDIP